MSCRARLLCHARSRPQDLEDESILAVARHLMLISAAPFLLDDLMALFDFLIVILYLYTIRGHWFTVLRTTYVDCVPP